MDAGEPGIPNVDVTIIAEKPKLAPFREAMSAKIAKLLDLPAGRVNVKATTRPYLGSPNDTTFSMLKCPIVRGEQQLLIAAPSQRNPRPQRGAW